MITVKRSPRTSSCASNAGAGAVICGAAVIGGSVLGGFIGDAAGDGLVPMAEDIAGQALTAAGDVASHVAQGTQDMVADIGQAVGDAFASWNPFG
ncbi:MAG: hypothetical protein H0V12_05040 [Chloroflexi bacterium]|nr:hypothetical protein [Chloroflexota bacterium]